MSLPKIVYFSLGSNLGDRAAQIGRAVEALAAAKIRPLRQSSLYLTEPVGGPDQRPYLNCAIEAETEWMPRELLREVQRVERQLGRHRLVPNGPRAIDIDILFYGTIVIRSRDLTIPHPRIAERRFVLLPLSEIAAGLRHPVLQQTIAELLAASADRSAVWRWRPADGGAV
jgi:2-amino-4-hydroxy-6-hydroxymethyldihydropteridine diphosphokinase